MMLDNTRLPKCDIKEFNNLSYLNMISQGIFCPKIRKDFIDMCQYIINKYNDLFNRQEYIEIVKTDHVSTNILEYIIPFYRKVYSNFFIYPPKILIGNLNVSRLIKFQKSFDIDELTLLLNSLLSNNKNILDDFIYIDRYSTLFQIICDEYVSKKLKEL